MKYTNDYNLPSSIVRAITNDKYDKGDADFSATELLKPPQIVRLAKMHADEIVVDVSDEVWKLLGSGVHAILERADDGKNAVLEERLFAKYGDYTISGAMDRREKHKIVDYKVTGAYKIIKKDFTDWESQLNIYAWLARQNGLNDIEELSIVAMLRDWKKSSRFKERNYPHAPIVEIQIPLWSDQRQEDFIGERIYLHTKDEIDPCSPSETWGGVRCRDWCEASEFCEQYQSR